MKDVLKRSLAMFMATVMIVTSMPLQAFAQEAVVIDDPEVIQQIIDGNTDILTGVTGDELPSLLPEEKTEPPQAEEEALPQPEAEVVVEEQAELPEETPRQDEQQEAAEENQQETEIPSDQQLPPEAPTEDIGEIMQTMAAVSDSGSWGNNIRWELSYDILVISGTGAIEPGYEYSSWQNKYGKQIKEVIVREGITSLCPGLFRDHTALKKVSLPDTLETIYDNAFRNCTSLEEITIPENVKKIYGDTFSGIFRDCTSLKKVTILCGEEADIGYLGDNTAITELHISHIDDWCQVDFAPITAAHSNKTREYTLYLNGQIVANVNPSLLVSRIGKYTFYDNDNISWVDLPESILSIGDYAFHDCDGLSSVYIPTYVESIGEGAFGWCDYLEYIALPNGLKSIGREAFYNSENIEEIIIPATVDYIGENAFGYTNAKVYFEGTTAQWQKITDGVNTGLFYGQLSITGDVREFAYTENSDGTVTITGIGSAPTGTLNIPAYIDGKDVTEIGRYAFADLGLTGVVIPATVKKIGERAFYNNNLSSITFNKGLEEIGEEAFLDAFNNDYYNYPKGITLPEGLKIIGNRAFDVKNKSLILYGTVYIPATVEKVGVEIFPNGNDIVYGNYTIVYGGSPQQWIDCVEINDMKDYYMSQMEFEDIDYSGNNFAFARYKEYEYSDKAEDYYALMYMNCSTEKVVIPSEYNGLPVKVIYNGKLNENVTSLTVPETIFKWDYNFIGNCYNLKEAYIYGYTDYEWYMNFSGCPNLETVYLSPLFSELEYDMFEGCNNLQNIYYSSEYNWNKSNVEIPETAKVHFEHDWGYRIDDNTIDIVGKLTTDEKLVIPEELHGLPVQEIGKCFIEDSYRGAFEGNTTLKEVVIPDSVRYLREDSFKNCINLKTVYLPNSLSWMENAFPGCTNITDVYFESQYSWEKESYASVFPANATPHFEHDWGYNINEYEEWDQYKQDWVKISAVDLYGKVNIGEKLVIPSEFKGLPVREVYGFAGNTTIKELVIPAGVKNVSGWNSGAFEGCTALEKLVIEGSTDFSEGTFANCTNLKTIYLPLELWGVFGWKDYPQNIFQGCTSIKDVYYESQFNWENDYKALAENVLPADVNMHFEHDWGYNVYETGDWDWESGQYINRYNAVGITGKVNIGETLEIPAEINGMPVGNVEEEAFAGNKDIEKLIIKGNTCLYDRAFAECINLKEIIFDSAVYSCYLYRTAFDGVPKNIKITVPSDSYIKTYLKEYGFTNIIEKSTSKVTITLPKTINVSQCGTTTVKATVKPANATVDLLWTVVDESIATVDQNGIVTGIKPGTTTLVVKDRSNPYVYTSATLTVSFPSTEKFTYTLSPQPDTAGLQAGETMQMTVMGNTLGVVDAEMFTFASSDPTLATVDANGQITVVNENNKSGTVKITAALKNDAKKRNVIATLKVIPAQVENLEIYTIQLGEEDGRVILPKTLVLTGTYPFTVAVNATTADGTQVKPQLKWASSNTKVATVKDGVVTLAKGADGIAVITATVNDLKKATASITIDVRDYAPRTETTSVKLNTYKYEGVDFELAEAYGNTIYDVRLEGDERFYADYDCGVVVVNTTEPVKGTFKLSLFVNTQMGEYTLPLTVVAEQKLPAVTIKQVAPFELFLKDSQATMQITAKDAIISNVDFATQSFTSVYEDGVVTVEYADPADPISCFDAKGKPVTKGTMTVTFEGYREDVAVSKAVTLKTKETKVTLNPSRKASTYTAVGNDNTPITLTDSKTKEVYDLDYFTVTAQPTSEAYVEIGVNGTQLTINPVLNDEGKFDADGKLAHTAKIDVQHENWVKPVTITHSFKINTAIPTLKLKAGTITLNRNFGTVGQTVIVPNIDNYPELEWEVIPQPVKGNDAQLEKLYVTVDGWNVETGFVNDEDPAVKGSYNYLLKTVIGEKDISLKLTVKVDETMPKIALAKTSVTLNGQINEDTEMLFKEVAGYEITGAEITNGVGNNLTDDDITVEYEDGKIKVSVNSSEIKDGKYKYDILPSVKLAGDGYTKEANLAKPITITVSVYNKVPNVTYSAKGKIDLTNRNTGIVYTLTKGTNFVYSPADVDTNTFALTGADAELFTVEYIGTDAKGQHMVEVKAKADAQLKKGGKYSYNIAVNIAGIEAPVEAAKAFAVSTSQSALKVAATGNTTIYQSFKGVSSIKIDVTSPAGAGIADMVVLETKATTLPEGALIYNVIQTDDGNWKVNYRVLDASKLKANATYKMTFEITPEGNGEGVKPQTFTVTLKVKR